MHFTNFVSYMLTTQMRLELTTSAVTGRRSNQLSHWALLKGTCTFKTAYGKYFHPKLQLRVFFCLPASLVMPSTD